jgi:hypothetical protein
METSKEDFKRPRQLEGVTGIANTTPSKMRPEVTLEVHEGDTPRDNAQLPSLSDTCCGQPNMRSPASM